MGGLYVNCKHLSLAVLVGVMSAGGPAMAETANVLWTVPAASTAPCVRADALDHVVVADSNGGGVNGYSDLQRRAPDGTLLWSVQVPAVLECSGGHSPIAIHGTDITVGGALYATCSETCTVAAFLGRYDASGGLVWGFDPAAWIGGVAVDPAGDVYVGSYVNQHATDGFDVSKYDGASGQQLWTRHVAVPAGSQYALPSATAVLASGELMVGAVEDGANGHGFVLTFGPDGEMTTSPHHVWWGASGVMAHPAGEAFVWSNDRLEYSGSWTQTAWPAATYGQTLGVDANMLVVGSSAYSYAPEVRKYAVGPAVGTAWDVWPGETQAALPLLWAAPLADWMVDVAGDSAGNVLVAGNGAVSKLSVALDVDADGDGFPPSIDCNDANPLVHPGAAEVLRDGIDQDCDGHDLTIDVRRATWFKGTLSVKAKSAYGAGAALRTRLWDKSTRAMTYDARRDLWTLDVALVQPPVGAVITVYGAEGRVSVGGL